MSLSLLAPACLSAIEDELRSVVAEADGGRFDEYRAMLSYHLGWTGEGAGPSATGKRLRPLLVVQACAAAGGDWQRALPAAAAVELIHNFSLIHDDIQDGSPLRRGRPTVWQKWGIAQAINAGDALFALARLAAYRLADRGIAPGTVLSVAQVLDRTCLQLTQGQHLDMWFEALGEVGAADYWAMIEGKTAALIGACTESGALIAEAPGETVGHFREFGRALGLAFQVQDDILGIWGQPEVTGKSVASDLATRKKSLPVIVGLSRCQEFRDAYRATASPQDDIARMAALLEECGARQLAESEAARWTEAAKAHLRLTQAAGPAATALWELTAELLNRRG